MSCTSSRVRSDKFPEIKTVKRLNQANKTPTITICFEDIAFRCLWCLHHIFFSFNISASRIVSETLTKTDFSHFSFTQL